MQALLDRVESLQKMCKQKDNFLQSTKMILKFRETHIANLEKNTSSEPTDTDQGNAIVRKLTCKSTPYHDLCFLHVVS